jgi:tRNA (guanine-N7-)-methyltransferase
MRAELARSCWSIHLPALRHYSVGVGNVLHQRKEKIASLQNILKQLPANKPLTVEFGCGHGHWLTSYASQHPQQLCLGIDNDAKRIQAAQLKQRYSLLDNLSFVGASASELAEAMASIVKASKVYILFPEPWRKEKHHPRRMLQPKFFDLLCKCTTDDVLMFVRTDDKPLHEWHVEQARASQWNIVQRSLDFEFSSVFSQYSNTYYDLVLQRNIANNEQTA